MQHSATARAARTRPPVSVVVATHARSEFLAECVSSIAADLAEGDELFVVECCASGGTDALAGFAADVKHLQVPHAGKTAKQNAGIRAAHGEMVLFTDDDCRVPRGWVEGMTRPFANPAVAMTFGRVRGLSAPPETTMPRIPAGPAPTEVWFYAHGASMALRAAAIRDVGGFDERLGPGTPEGSGEEHDLVLRFVARGWTCEITDGPVVEHLEWRDRDETMRNLLVYQRGTGAYLGAGLRRNPARALKYLLLRLALERGVWQGARAFGPWIAPRMSWTLARGLVDGLGMPPRRFLDAQLSATRARPRPRVLWITDEPPDRNLGGGNIRQAMLLDSIGRKLAVTLLVMGGRPDELTRIHLEEVIELPLPAARPAPRSLTERRIRDLWHAFARRLPSEVVGRARLRRILKPVVNRVANDFDVVVVHHLYLAPILPKQRRAVWVLHLFDVLSLRARQELAVEPGRRQRLLLSREVSKAERFQHAVATQYDALVVVSEDDATAIMNGSRRAHSHVAVVPNGVDPSAFAPTSLPRQPRLLLPASFNYRPNVIGARWFCDEVLPLVQTRVPEVSLDLVGRQPVDDVLELGRRTGITVHPDVADMSPWFEKARVVIVPLHIGTGTRVKVLEAMAAGRPVVGTSIGLEGLGIIDQVHALVADDPIAMADAIVGVLTSDRAAAGLVAEGRRLVNERFRWDSAADRLAAALESAANPVTNRR